MTLRSLGRVSLKTETQNEIMLLGSLKTAPLFKENPSLKTFDLSARLASHSRIDSLRNRSGVWHRTLGVPKGTVP